MAPESHSVERYGGGAISVKDYDPTWVTLFEQEKARIEAALGSLGVRIEHFGSTAVPGLPAKPIIDILVGVQSMTEARASCIASLSTLGYTHITGLESWLPSLFFRMGGAGTWTHHLHVLEPSHPQWTDWLLFRDYLREHPDVARAYADVKRALAFVCGDRIADYRNGKHGFISAVIARARAER